jgi:hypothetical protein
MCPVTPKDIAQDAASVLAAKQGAFVSILNAALLSNAKLQDAGLIVSAVPDVIDSLNGLKDPDEPDNPNEPDGPNVPYPDP